MKSPYPNPFRCACLGLAVLSCQSQAAPNTWNPPAYVSPYIYHWGASGDWSAGVPNATSDVIIPERLIPSPGGGRVFFGPIMDVHSTIQSLTFGPYTRLSNSLSFSPGKNLFVDTATEMHALSIITNIGGTFTLGTLSTYDAGTKTLNNCTFNVGDREGNGIGILEFAGADIVTSKATLYLSGPATFIRDQHTGLSAFRNFAANQGQFQIADGYTLSTNGNFTNTGIIQLNSQFSTSLTRTPELNIAGNFVNNGIVTLYGKTVLTVAGGYSGTGTIRIMGGPVTCNVLGALAQNGGEVDFGSGIDSFTLNALQWQLLQAAKVKGSGSIQADVTVTNGTIAPGNSAGKITVKGNLTLESAAALEMEVAGTSLDQIVQSLGSTGTTLAGVLKLSVIGDLGSTVLDTSKYEILVSDLPLLGNFSNVASGSRLDTVDGKGSFRVDYGPTSAAPNKVVLSEFEAYIEQKSYSEWIEGQDLSSPDDLPAADPNKDGVTNLQAYFRGIAAVGGSNLSGITTTTDGTNLIVRMLADKAAFDVDLTSQVATTPGSWAPGPLPQLVGETPTRDIYQVTVPFSSNRRFVRFVMQGDVGSGGEED